MTASTPKPMLPVAGRPFLDTLIQEVARYGFDEIVLLAGRFGEQIVERYDATQVLGATIKVLVEPKPLGTGGALRFAADHLRQEFVLLNGDTWINADLTVFAQHWLEAKRKDPALSAQLLLQHVDEPGRFGAVEFDQGRVTAFREKDPSAAAVPGYINAGVYCLDRKIVSAMAPGEAISLETDILPGLVEKASVAAFPARKGAYFIDIGVPESYAQAQRELEEERRKPALFLDRDGTLNEDDGYTHKAEDLLWKEGAREAIRFANDAGYYVFVVTNQAGVAHGYYTEADVIAFHAAMKASLVEIGAHIDAFEWCPYHPEAKLEDFRQKSPRRKPEPGMLLDLATKFPIDLPNSIMVGNAESDVAAGEAANIRGILYSDGSLLDLVKREIPKRDNINVD
ncbi:HAD-IIIA family hydrolase [Martelella sp. HB161492]|uniref:HAD-IIIA family hydrolase n=1 Tax=Martelella sp. HB161492 TaxID=2720726 RepID=UPI001FEF545D|nr:HAD-IIIA family hydrolase [Martelella sp. HB161492]